MGHRFGIRHLVLSAAIGAGMALPLLAQTTPTARRHPAIPAQAPAQRASSDHARTVATSRPAARSAPVAATPTVKTNPFLPPPIAIDGFFADLTLSPKAAPTAPAGFEPLVTEKEWQTYRAAFGAEADKLSSARSSGQIAFAQKLIDAAGIEPGPEAGAYSPGVRRLLLLRAAAIAYRSTGGFPTADKAVTAYTGLLDRKSPAQVGALWSVANIMARTAVTPKPDRIRYDAVAARANMQLALLMLDVDQIDAAQAITKQVGYHEGWLKSDPATRAQIAQVRADVKQSAATADLLAGLYRAALKNDPAALTTIYLYGRYVKGNVALVSNLPPRVPESPLAQLVQTVDAAQRGDIQSAFKGAEMLRAMAASQGDARIRARTLYAAMQLYDAYMASPLTEKDRVQRTLARIAREGVVADGARKAVTIDPFAAPPGAAGTIPGGSAPGAPAPASPVPGAPRSPSASAVRLATL